MGDAGRGARERRLLAKSARVAKELAESQEYARGCAEHATEMTLQRYRERARSDKEIESLKARVWGLEKRLKEKNETLYQLDRERVMVTRDNLALRDELRWCHARADQPEMVKFHANRGLLFWLRECDHAEALNEKAQREAGQGAA